MSRIKSSTSSVEILLLQASAPQLGQGMGRQCGEGQGHRRSRGKRPGSSRGHYAAPEGQPSPARSQNMAAHAGELEARPQMLLGVVDAKADQLRQGAAQLGDESQPLPFGVGQEDGHGSQLGIAGPQAG